MNGQLYTGVRKQDKTGRVLHWIGTTTNPFVFEEIADIEAYPPISTYWVISFIHHLGRRQCAQPPYPT